MPEKLHIFVPLHFFCALHLDCTYEWKKTETSTYHAIAIYVPTTIIPLKFHICNTYEY